MHKTLLTSLAISLFIFLNTSNQAQNIPQSFAKKPLLFTENKGQLVDDTGKLRPDIAFTAMDKGVKMYFGRDRLSYVFTQKEENASSESPDKCDILTNMDIPEYSLQRIDMQFLNCNKNVEIEGLEK